MNNNYSLSTASRTSRLEQLSEEKLDILVIGGGITGAGISLDAAARGLKTGLIEMQDFAAGTSSRSTKLVHGGLRYLKQLEVKLVAEVGKERAVVYENAPHVTEPQWMLLPIIKKGTFGRTATSFGLRIYDALAKVKKEEQRFMLTKGKTLEKEPLLRTEDLIGSGVYVEYRTDDARLTLEAIKKGAELGANPVNYTRAESFIYVGSRIKGVQVKDLLNGRTYSIYAENIVNAAGPWVDNLRDKDGSKTGKHLHLTKGTHLVFDRHRFPLRQATYFDAPDGRMLFAIPRDKKTYVGTTDTTYDAEIASPRMTIEDRDYILKMVNNMFPSLKLSTEDVESSWAGLRPLIYEEGKSASEISRKDEVFVSDSGLISIAGGKLTGYRKMADKIVNLIVKQMNLHAPCPTAEVPLSGGNVGGSSGFETFVKKEAFKGVEAGLAKEEAEFLLRFYGSNALKIFELLEENIKKAKDSGLPLKLAAQLIYALEYEMSATPLDFFNRRTGKLYFAIEDVGKWQDGVTAFMKAELGWTEEETNQHKTELQTEVNYAKLPVEEVDNDFSRIGI
ncbi:glycerol-3-phosphate dehydrogenase/oxidase [Alteribacillus sp. HJP-4]|uniref:glycerol-3-phosphate dehydrogenase/oxidase n=1 Tax=Alteribacillus sp. HJP-4 TaxID=2775394 RepID=UPI0035CD21B9